LDHSPHTLTLRRMTLRVTVAQVPLPPRSTLPAAADASAHASHAGTTCLLPRHHTLMMSLHQLL